MIRVMEVIHAKADGSVFIVMEFVDGGNLYDAMKKGDYFSREKAAGVARDVLRGLSHMHRRGFFHRDIKPENILVPNKPKLPRDVLELGPHILHVLLNPLVNLAVKTLNYADNLALSVLLMQRRSRCDNRRRQFGRHGATAAPMSGGGA